MTARTCTGIVLAIGMIAGACESAQVVAPEQQFRRQAYTEGEALGSLEEAEALAAELEAAGIHGTTVAFLGRPSEFPGLSSYIESETIARTFPFIPHISHDVSVNIVRNGVFESWSRPATPLLGIAVPAFTSVIDLDIDCALMKSETTLKAWTTHIASYNIPYIMWLNPLKLNFLAVNPKPKTSGDHDECVIITTQTRTEEGGNDEGTSECYLRVFTDWYVNGEYSHTTYADYPIDSSYCIAAGLQ